MENKIRASEQENQLMRYFTFIQKNGHADAILLYLTLNGCESIDKTLSTGKEYTAISYATHILQWLESCTQLAANHPTLRETIVQYVQLIQKLTNQHSNQLMNKEIAAVILKNSSNLKAFFDLQGMGPYIKDQLIKKLEEDITEFCRSSGKVELSKFNLSYKEYTGFEIHNDFLRSKNLAICFEFDLANLSDFCLGFIYIDQNKPTNKQYIKKLQEEFISTFGKHQSSAFWPSYISMPKYTNWDEQTFLAIQDGSFLKAIIESINKLLECAADAE
ncbi:PD-(D/E)XK nuclease family protein [Saprospira grandis]|uniref:PD-(D/E)XK nuclease family protein n=1 Tax=Saprospira grandis TaxID=1008 RepID=UPI0032C414FD